jgi:nucleolar MIF4G domain-containing protein 1
MNRGKKPKKGPKLPHELLEQLGVTSQAGKKGKRGPLGRKEQRKAARVEKRKPKVTHRPFSQPSHRMKESEDEEEEDEKEDQVEVEERPAKKPRISQKDEPVKKKELVVKSVNLISRADREAMEDDDAEIAFLEKKLGLKGKKKSKSLEDDGLADLLGEIDDAVTGEYKEEDRDWLKSKRRKAQVGVDNDSEDEDMDDEEGSQSELDEDIEMMEDDEDELVDTEDGEEDQDEDDFNDLEPEPAPKVRENPYRPPTDATTKYIPPSLRAPMADDEETMVRLRRQIQGLLNRLSESNILSIVKDVDKIFSSNARQYVITSLIDLLMGLLCDRSALMDTFIILHAAFVNAMYKLIGTHFGAQFLERFVAEFTKFYDQETQTPTGSKETSNLISLLSALYSFQMVSSNIMFDYIRLFFDGDLTDLNAELILRLIKSCGPQLRSDDPATLKEIVILVQKAVAKTGEANLSVRTKFMIETIMNLKNNKVKNLGSQMATESIMRMRKTIGTMTSRSANGVEPLGIGLKDMQQADKGGKWWLVGASWRNTAQSEPQETKDHDGSDEEDDKFENETIFEGEPTTADLLKLAKEHRMNTDVRRGIFVTILSSSDYKDAYLRLQRLRLNKKQQLEIPRILVHCAGFEETYNPYYALIAEQVATKHNFRKAFEFNFWSFLRRLGEKQDLSDDESDNEREEVTLRELVNIAKMYGELIASLSLPITILKVSFYPYLCMLQYVLPTILMTVFRFST